MIPLLSLVTFLPGAAGLALLFVPRRSVGVLRVASLAVTVVTFVLSLPLYVGFDPEIIGYQFEENRRWMPTLGAAYHVGIDGISLLLVLLTTFLMPLALGSASGRISCSSPSPWPSRSRCRCSRSTPGSRTPTSRRPPPAAWSSPACCSRWGRTDSCASVYRFFRTRVSRSGPWCGRSR